jgi:predicted Zn-dependent protease
MESGVPGYVRSHPLTTDRIADMQDRVRGLPSQKVFSSIEFYLLKARSRLIQTTSSSNYPELKQYFESLARKPDLSKQLEGQYGLTLLSMKQGRLSDAEGQLQKTRATLQSLVAQGSPIQKYSLAIESTGIDLMMANGQTEAALKQLALVKSFYPRSRSLNVATINAQLKTKQYEQAITWLKTQSRSRPDESLWWSLLAQAYSQSGKRALQHSALAEKYVTEGAWVGAIEQMKLAKLAGDADFYQISEIDARARQIQEAYRQELKNNRQNQ